MAVTLYRKDNGNPAVFAYIIDAKESLKTGFYVKDKPAAVPEPAPEPIKPKPESKPQEPVKAKTLTVEPDVVEDEKPVVKKPVEKAIPRIIRK